MASCFDAEEDRLSSLPDALLSDILSRLPLKWAVRCSILSRRWTLLYTMLPRLSFSPYAILGESCDKAEAKVRLENIIFRLLLSYTGDLRAFHLDAGSVAFLNFSSDNVCSWVRFAAKNNVQELHLNQYCYRYNDITGNKATPPAALFSCAALTTLSLRCYDLTRLPPSFSGFYHLTSCCLQNVSLSYESLETISHFPLLKHLYLSDLFADDHRLAISASNLVRLEIYRIIHNGLRCLSIRCPKLARISLRDIDTDLQLYKIPLYEFSNKLVCAKMAGNGDLVELELGPRQMRRANFAGFPATSRSRFLEIIGSLKTLKTLKISSSEGFSRKFPITALLECLPNLEAFSLTDPCRGFEDMDYYHMEVSHDNLKTVEIKLVEYTEREIPMLACILESTPSLKVMTIVARKSSDRKYICFLEKVLLLKKASSCAEIRLVKTKFR